MTWPEAVSDGLTLPCGLCGVVPKFDYRITGTFWHELVPVEHRRGVVCLPCLDGLASAKGLRVEDALIEVQFTGRGVTVILKPEWVHRYEGVGTREP